MIKENSVEPHVSHKRLIIQNTCTFCTDTKLDTLLAFWRHCDGVIENSYSLLPSGFGFDDTGRMLEIPRRKGTKVFLFNITVQRSFRRFPPITQRLNLQILGLFEQRAGLQHERVVKRFEACNNVEKMCAGLEKSQLPIRDAVSYPFEHLLAS